KKYNISLAHSESTLKSCSKTVFISTYPEKKLLCPYETITDLMTRTHPWKNFTEQKCALFLIMRDPHISASVDTIANWIKFILNILSPDLTAKNMRSLATC